MTQVRDRLTRKVDQLTELRSPTEATAQVTILPLATVHEARFALQQIKDEITDPSTVLEVIEPLARVIGWAESAAYFFGSGGVTAGRGSAGDGVMGMPR